MIDTSVCSKGGGVQVALSLINNIVMDSIFEVILVASPQIDTQLTEDIKSKISHYYVELDESILGKKKQGRRLAFIEKKHKPDFVFVVFGPSYWKPKAKSLQGFALGKMLYQKELNIGFIEKTLNFIKALFFKWSKSFLLVETQLVKEKLSDHLNYSSDKIFVISNSYSPSFLKNIVDNRNILTAPFNFFQILVPGSYYPHKNIERIILSLVNLIEINENIQLKVVFTIPENSIEWHGLYDLAKKYNVDNLISTVGFVENAKFAELYLKSNAVICASLVESSTAVFPEAFLAERPLLVSDRPFAKELCENAALYFDPLDPKSIANTILKIYDNRELQNTLIKNGKIVLKKNYPSAEDKWIQQRNLILKLVK